MNNIDTDVISTIASQSTVCVLAGGRADVNPKCHSGSLTSEPRGVAPSWALAPVTCSTGPISSSEPLPAARGLKACIFGGSCETWG